MIDLRGPTTPAHPSTPTWDSTQRWQPVEGDHQNDQRLGSDCTYFDRADWLRNCMLEPGSTGLSLVHEMIMYVIRHDIPEEEAGGHPPGGN